MLGIAPSHVGANALVRPCPEARQVISYGQWAARWGKQVELHTLPAIDRGLRQPKAFLQLDAHRGAIPGPVDFRVAPRGHGQAFRCQLIQARGFRPGEKALECWIHVDLGGRFARRDVV